MKRMIIIGRNSAISKRLIMRLDKVKLNYLTFSSSKCEETHYVDLRNLRDFDFGLLKKNDIIVFLSAISSPDYCSINFIESLEVNVFGTITFINEVLKRQARVIYFSSDTVYGDQNEEVNEDVMPTRPVGEYACMKFIVEKYFYNVSNVKIIRLSYVFHWNDKFMEYLHICRFNESPIEVFHPFVRSMVYIEDVLDGIISLFYNWDICTAQLYNFCGIKQYSRIDVVKLYNSNVCKLSFLEVNPPDSFFNARPRVINVSSKYAESLLGKACTDIEVAMLLEKNKFEIK